MEVSTQLPVTDIKQKLTTANSILIVLPQNHTVDTVAAGLALYLSLTQQFSDPETGSCTKSITIASGQDMTVAYQRLYGVGDISKKLGSKNLVITLNTPFENIDRITSDNDNGKLNIIIETKQGVNRLSRNEIDFSYRGLDADLIIAVGLGSTDQAGSLLSQETTLFTDKDIITLTCQPGAVPFGAINIHEPQACGVCEITAKLVRFLKLAVDEDIATNLLAGIEAVTNNFMLKTTADTFAAVSWCMRLGGRRNHLTGAVGNQIPQPAPFTMPTKSALPFSPTQQETVEPKQSASIPPFPPTTTTQEEQSSQTHSEEDVPPQKDWFEPKIFKTDTKIN